MRTLISGFVLMIFSFVVKAQGGTVKHINMKILSNKWIGTKVLINLPNKEKNTSFWGDTAIIALQNGNVVRAIEKVKPDACYADLWIELDFGDTSTTKFRVHQGIITAVDLDTIHLLLYATAIKIKQGSELEGGKQTFAVAIAKKDLDGLLDRRRY